MTYTHLEWKKPTKLVPLIAEDEIPNDMPTWAKLIVSKLNDLNQSIEHISLQVSGVVVTSADWWFQWEITSVENGEQSIKDERQSEV